MNNKAFYPFLLLLFHATTIYSQDIVLSKSNGEIYKFNLQECTTTLACDLSNLTDAFDMTFHPNGNLYIISSTGRLIQVDLNNCSTRLIHVFPPLGFLFAYNSLVCDGNGIFYVAAANGSLYSFNLSTSQAQFIGNMGYGAAGDLTFKDGKLLLSAIGNKIVEVNIQNPSNSKIFIDLNLSGSVEGIFSYAETCSEIESFIIAGNEIRSVNFVDKSTKLVCTLPFSAGGAGSTYEFFGSNPIYIDSLSLMNSSCDKNNGSIKVFAKGGVGKFNYSIDGVNYQADSVFLNLRAGEYKVYIRDENRCEITQIISLDSTSSPIIIETIVTQTSCKGNDGSINVKAIKGTGQLLYSIDGVNFQTKEYFSNLLTGDYVMTVKDSLECRATKSITISSIPPPLIQEISLSPSSCNKNNGSLLVNAMGGVGNLKYSIDSLNFQLDNKFSELSKGNYVLTVKDESNCETKKLFQIEAIEPPIIQSITTNPALCAINNGSLVVNAVSAISQVQYSIDGLNFQDNNTFTGLVPSKYTISIVDVLGCKIFDTVTIQSRSLPFLQNIEVLPTSCGESTGVVIINASGGTGELLYSINEKDFQRENSFYRLSEGEYKIEVRDSLSCSIDTSLIIKSDCNVYIPNVFSPNGDGINDYFRVYSFPNTNYVVKSFNIFDRWGNLIFTKANFSIDEPDSEWWGGIINDRQINPDIYIYYIEIIDKEGKVKLYKGSIKIL